LDELSSTEGIVALAAAGVALIALLWLTVLSVKLRSLRAAQRTVLGGNTLALLDSHRTGVVVSSILHRDQARVYVKPVREGTSEVELSPEEQEAIETAMAPSPAST
jgi:hypothetical protein